MKKMVHPNGCVHDVRDDLVDRFKAAGWKIKAARNEPPKDHEAPAAPEEPEAEGEAEDEPTSPAKPKRGRTRNEK